MSLRPIELAQVCAELSERLRGAVAQRAYVPSPGLCFLELRVPGQSALLCLSAQAGLGRLSIAAERPVSPAQASTLQQVLRRELCGARLASIRHQEGAKEVTLEWEKAGKLFRLHLELSGAGALVLTGGDEKVLAVHAAPERGLRAGGTFSPPAAGPSAASSTATPLPAESSAASGTVTPPAVGSSAASSTATPLPAGPSAAVGTATPPAVGSSAAPGTATPLTSPGAAPSARSSSRLVPDPAAPFPFAEAAERLFAGKDVSRRADAARRALTGALRAKLSRTERTLPKVRAEASRQPEAEGHRQAGELVSRNLHLLTRGAREVRLTEYTAQGPVERVVPLDPALPPKAQAERHFHQYRRLLRGCEHAARRLVELTAEHEALTRELSRLEALGEDELLGLASRGPAPKKAGPSVASPYREYRSARGERIWVGKNAAGNDALTFEVASAQDLWLHARGVPGSHVVVPLAKNTVLPQELLLDAAHLAVHHSDAKAEPRAEVSYTSVKFVHRQKGGSPGQVTFTREKTLLVRLEPERLRRLLASAAAP